MTRPCQLCGEDYDGSARLAEDRAGNVRWPSTATHRECALRSAVGGIGHLVAHPYWCVERHDPDAGLTYRQSALLVDEFVHLIGVDAAVDYSGHL